jgi:preprotein translocase subunit SecA
VFDLFGFLKRALDPTKKELAALSEVAVKVLALELQMKSLSIEQLSSYSSILRDKLANGAKLDDILPEAFALVREASVRLLFIQAGLPK